MMATALPWLGALASDRSRPGAESATGAREDLEDIRCVLAGDPDRYARLVERHQRTIALYMWRFSREPATCEELVQTVFVQAYLSLAKYRGEAPFQHWLKKIATHVGFNHWKKKKRERIWVQWEIERTPAPATERRAASVDDRDLLYRLLEQIPPAERILLTMIYLEEMETAEIAELLGSSQTLVRVRAHRARARLRKLLVAHREDLVP